MIHVPVIPPDILIPKVQLIELLEKEASDFIAAIKLMEIPPSGDRLAVPIIVTEEKRLAEEANLTYLELFIKENVYQVDGEIITIAEFFDKFQEFLPPAEFHDWSKNKVSSQMPQHFPKGRSTKLAGTWCYGNISWKPRRPEDPVKPRLVIRDTMLVPEVKNGS